eukprot:scpid86385/ scgid33133/ 
MARLRSTVVVAVVAYLAYSVFFAKDGRRERLNEQLRRNKCIYNSEFRMTRDQRLMSFCKAVYDVDERALENWTCSWCQEHHANFQLHKIIYKRKFNTKALVGYDPELNATVLAFRGTTTNDVDTSLWNKNWLRVNLNGLDFGNTSCVPHHLGKTVPGRVYCGFYEAYVDFRRSLLRAVNASLQLHPDAPLYVTGHSLGGALAALATLDVRLRRFRKQPILVTFGAPEMADRAFSTYYSCAIRQALRVYNLFDVVPYSMGDILRWPRHVGKAKVSDKSIQLSLKPHYNYLGVNTHT